MYLLLVVADARRRDIDNFVKAVLDLLKHHELIDDDRWNCGFVVDLGTAKEARCEVIVNESDGPIEAEIEEAD